MTAGLGEKYLVFSEDADAEEVHLELLQAYPKLQTAGGYVTFCILIYNIFPHNFSYELIWIFPP